MINATARTSHAEPTEEAFPSRGHVGMFCLIATEAALFSILSWPTSLILAKA